MPVEWLDYNNFDWANAQQEPMQEGQGDALLDLVADILSLTEEDRQRVWGAASPPGRYAATVIRVQSGIRHGYQEQATECRIAEIGVKVFKTTKDAQREAQRMLPFHGTYVHHLPGLPNEHVQKSLAAGTCRDKQGAQRIYVIQEWVVGNTLEDLLRQRWSKQPIDAVRVRSLLEQLLAGIIIPLWGEGTIWWDVRDANYCYAETSNWLTLIDIDSLAVYADEILQTPEVWERRDKGRKTALARLRQMTLRLLLAQGLRNKKKIETSFTNAWQTELEPALWMLGRESQRKKDASIALRSFLDRLEHMELL